MFQIIHRYSSIINQINLLQVLCVGEHNPCSGSLKQLLFHNAQLRELAPEPSSNWFSFTQGGLVLYKAINLIF